jgi:hypothetical protein
VLPQQGLVVMAIVIGVSLARRASVARRASLTVLDITVAALFAVFLLNVIAGIRGANELLDNVVAWGIPYAAARLTVDRELGARDLARAIVVLSVAMIPFAAAEMITGKNIFATLVANPALGAVWAPGLERLGVLRPEVALGHPIALSMVLAAAVVLAVGLFLIGAQPATGRSRWLVCGGALALATVATLSRTGLLLLAAASILGLIAVNKRTIPLKLRRDVSRIGLAIAGLLALFAVTPPGRMFFASLTARDSTSEIATSTRGRAALLEVADRGDFTILGSRQGLFTGTGITSVDNTYLWLVDRWGLAAAVLLTLAIVYMIWWLLVPRAPRFGTMFVVTAAASLVAMFFVAPITQHQSFLFLLLGAASACIRSSRSPDVGAEDP